jgi:hypothetical protein
LLHTRSKESVAVSARRASTTTIVRRNSRCLVVSVVLALSVRGRRVGGLEAVRVIVRTGHDAWLVLSVAGDPMLQLRNFSYFDTQISRLGGPNFNALPINRGMCFPCGVAALGVSKRFG